MSNCRNTLNWIPVCKAVQYEGEAGGVVQGIAVTFQISVDATSSIFDWASRSPRRKYSTRVWEAYQRVFQISLFFQGSRFQKFKNGELAFWSILAVKEVRNYTGNSCDRSDRSERTFEHQMGKSSDQQRAGQYQCHVFLCIGCSNLL